MSMKVIEPITEARGDYIRKLLGDVDLGPGATWAVKQRPDNTCMLQIFLLDKGVHYQSTKWPVPPVASKRQILGVAFFVVSELVQNRLRDEYFKYKGVPVFHGNGKHDHLLGK